MKETKANMLRVLVLAYFVSFKASLALECGECKIQECPETCEVQIEDPCGCCRDGICAGTHGEPCSDARPCSKEFICDKSPEGSLCTCKQDKRPVCGQDGITYDSICDLNAKTQSGLKKWGVCDMPPTIISASSHQTLAIGQPLTLDCEVRGNPVPSIVWHFVGKRGHKKILPGDDQMTAIQLRGGPEPLMVTSWMQIVSLRDIDEGLYICVATNIHGEAKAEALISQEKKAFLNSKAQSKQNYR